MIMVIVIIIDIVIVIFAIIVIPIEIVVTPEGERILARLQGWRENKAINWGVFSHMNINCSMTGSTESSKHWEKDDFFWDTEGKYWSLIFPQRRQVSLI